MTSMPSIYLQFISISIMKLTDSNHFFNVTICILHVYELDKGMYFFWLLIFLDTDLECLFYFVRKKVEYIQFHCILKVNRLLLDFVAFIFTKIQSQPGTPRILVDLLMYTESSVFCLPQPNTSGSMRKRTSMNFMIT